MKFQVSKPVLAGREREYALDAIDSGWISSVGDYIARFETSVGAYFGREPGLAVTSGTTALHLACLAMGLRPGQDVIVPALTYVASANAVSYCGGRPVFADSDPTTWNVTRETIEQAWTPNTVGVMLVHLYGLPAPGLEIAELCREKGVWLIEDCAQAIGAKISDACVGSFGQAACFSFFGNKIISTGEGGMLFMSDPDRQSHAKILRGQGMDLTAARRYSHVEVGYNYRMTNVAAAIGLGQIEMIDAHLAARQDVAMAYIDALGALRDSGALTLPAQVPDYHNVYWLFSVVIPEGGAERRDEIERVLLQRFGIDTRPFFTPMHKLPMYLDTKRQLPAAEFLGDHGFNLPTYTGLTANEVAEIANGVTETISQVG